MTKKKNNHKGTFTISIDTEMAWGSIYDEKILKKKHESFKRTRTAIWEILKLFEKYNISATWAMVGHLMLENCYEVHGEKHPDVVRPSYSWLEKDWFHYDPCERKEENSIWYGNDIVEKIKDCKVKQEIGSHSFSHIMFGNDECSIDCAESDIKKWVEIAKMNGIKPGSFVFPFNSVGHLNIIKHYGFTIYRSKNKDKFVKFKNHKIKRLLLIMDKIFALCPSTGNLEMDNSGLLKIPGDFCYFRYNGWRNYFTWNSAVRKAKKGIDKAIEKGEVFHFWFHPFEVATNLEESISDFDVILNYAQNKINQGLLINKTMSQLQVGTDFII